MKSKLVIPTLALSILLAGCASVAVTEDAIVERTAFALGLDKGKFTITNRLDDGLTSRYSVTANNQQYNCYVTGTVSVLGRVVSEAVCTKKGEVAKNPLLR